MHAIITHLCIALIVFSRVIFGEYANGDYDYGIYEIDENDYGQYEGEMEENDPANNRVGTERFFGAPFGGFGGRPHAPPFGGPPAPQFGGRPASHFKGPQFGGHHHAGPPGAQHGGGGGGHHHGGPPGAQHGGGHAWYPNGGGPHENSMDEETDEELEEGIDLPLVATKVVDKVLLLLRPMLTQALTTELIAQGLDTANAHVHLPFPRPGFFPGPGHQHHFQNHHQHDQDLDEFLDDTDEDIDDHHFGPGHHGRPGTPTPFGMFAGQSIPPGGMFGAGQRPHGMFGGGPPPNPFLGMQRNAPKQPSEEEDDLSSTEASDSCRVVEGPAQGKDCVFPFVHKGEQHNTCVYYPDEGDTFPWCSTKVDAEGVHVVGEDEWGRCDPENDKCKTQT